MANSQIHEADLLGWLTSREQGLYDPKVKLNPSETLVVDEGSIGSSWIWMFLTSMKACVWCSATSEMYGSFEPSETLCGCQNHDKSLNEFSVIQQQLTLLYFSRIQPTSPSQQLDYKVLKRQPTVSLMQQGLWQSPRTDDSQMFLSLLWCFQCHFKNLATNGSLQNWYHPKECS